MNNICELYTILPDNLKYLRKTHRLSQQKLSQLLHMTRKHYAAFEKGTSLPDIVTLCILTEYYSVTLHELIHTRLREEDD